MVVIGAPEYLCIHSQVKQLSHNTTCKISTKSYRLTEKQTGVELYTYHSRGGVRLASRNSNIAMNFKKLWGWFALGSPDIL